MKTVKTITLFIFILLMLSCNKEKKDEVYPTDVDSVSQPDTSQVDNTLPDPDDYDQDNELEDTDTEETDNKLPEKDTSIDDNDEEIQDVDTDLDVEAVDDENDNEQSDADETVFCFMKECEDHSDCSETVCDAEGEKYACAPEIEDFGYRNTSECVEIDCEKDSDCHLELGYICVDLGASLAEFNNGSSVCLKSIIGEPCSEEGKKICQFDRNIAIECRDGKWTPDFCETAEICFEGECMEEVTDSDSEIPDADTEPVEEICDNIDNNGNSQIDEGCDDDGDGWCDINMVVFGTPDICPNGALDCNDLDNTIYPGSVIHKEGVDYDCDNRKEYQAVIELSVDDQLVDLCANGRNVSPFGTYFGQWTYADTYSGQELVLESGVNVIGVHGTDTGASISAFIAVIEVNGQFIRSNGVLPPSDGIAYTSADPEWTQSQWRYFPTVAAGPNGDWCDKWFDDSQWGPAIKAGKAGTPESQWGNLGTNPWTTTACGGIMCPKEFIPYYQDAVVDNEPKWIWDYNPTSLADAWLRIKINLP